MLDNDKDLKQEENNRNNRRYEKRGLLTEEEANVENANFEDEEIENSNVPWHKKILKGMVTGVGFLSDAYDLYVSISFIPEHSIT